VVVALAATASMSVGNPRAAMNVVSGDREGLRAVTIEQREHYWREPGRRLRRGQVVYIVKNPFMGFHLAPRVIS